MHVEIVFITTGHARSATFNSLLTGMCIDVACSYLFIYRLDLGVVGAALVHLSVRLCRLLVWGALATHFGLWRLFFGSASQADHLFSWREARVFWKLAAPQVAPAPPARPAPAPPKTARARK